MVNLLGEVKVIIMLILPHVYSMKIKTKNLSFFFLLIISHNRSTSPYGATFHNTAAEACKQSQTV